MLDLTTIEATLLKHKNEFWATLRAVPTMRAGQVYQTGQGFPLTVNAVQYGHAAVEDVLAGRALAQEVVMTTDGKNAQPQKWHEGPPTDEEWVYYERWTPEGRVAHGWVDSVTRNLIQSG